MSLRSKFLALDDKLASHGVPALTAWWREGLGRWLDAYEHGHVLELWACVGRGAAKSTALYKLALFFTLFGDFEVPPGERHYAVVLSRLKEEAAKGIAIIDVWLSLLGVGHHLAGDVIDLDELPRGLRVVAASVAATSGWRAYFVAKDERSKWQAGGADDLDADEVDTSAAAMTATHPFAAVVTAGSAWGAFGGFFDAITAGTDDARVVLGPTPTWIAAPHISEESTHRKERNPRRWAREYACEFQAGSLGTFDSQDVARAMNARTLVPPQTWIGVCDPSSGSIDTFTYCRVGLSGEVPARHVFEGIGAVTAKEGLTAEQAVARIASSWRAAGIRHAVGDQRESWALTAMFLRHGIEYTPLPWTASSKPVAVEQVRRWLGDGSIVLPPHAAMKHELLNFEERVMPSGQISFNARRGGHDDYVALLITAALADVGGALPGEVPAETAAIEAQLLARMQGETGGQRRGLPAILEGREGRDHGFSEAALEAGRNESTIAPGGFFGR